MRVMRRSSQTLVLGALLAALAAPLAAQTEGRPTGLQPVPEPPPPPPGEQLDPALEPQVVIIKRGTDTIEEYRVGGKLYMIKVIPVRGAPYYMIDRTGDGKFVRDDTLGSNIRPPMWVIFTF